MRAAQVKELERLLSDEQQRLKNEIKALEARLASIQPELTAAVARAEDAEELVREYTR